MSPSHARQLVNRQELSPETVRRMHSFFSRHEVDKEAEGFWPGEDGYPSPGRVAWGGLGGGDPGQSWARGKAAAHRIDGEERAQRVEEISGAVKEGLQNKVDEHNEKYGDQKGQAGNATHAFGCVRRGIGAYKTNPGSVRPTVTSPEQPGICKGKWFFESGKNRPV